MPPTTSNTGGYVKALAVALTLSTAGLAFIKSQEGTKTEAYLDSKGVPTICTGSTYNVKLGMMETIQGCDNRLKIDSSQAAKAVQRVVKVPLSQNQFDSLVSFTFNVGEGNLAGSTLVRKLNTGDYCSAGKEFLRWNKVRLQGPPPRLKALPGLSKRRAAESALFLKGEHCAS